MRILLAATGFLAASASVSAEDFDPYEGFWASTGCGDKTQCWLEIEKKSEKIYDFKFVAADRMDSQKIVCERSSEFERGELNFTAMEQYPDALSGSLGKDQMVWLLPFGDGTVSLYVDDETCDGIDMMGEYGIIGD